MQLYLKNTAQISTVITQTDYHHTNYWSNAQIIYS